MNMTKQKQIPRYRGQTTGYQWGKGRGGRWGRELRGTNYYV